MQVRALAHDSVCDDFTAFCFDAGACPQTTEPIVRSAIDTSPTCIGTPYVACDLVFPVDCCSADGAALDLACDVDADCGWLTIASECREVTCVHQSNGGPGACTVQVLPLDTPCAGGACAPDGFCLPQGG